jgi:hypothetical protein
VPRFTISGRDFELDHAGIERCLRNRLPDPVHQHYVVVRGVRFPPKQVLSCATGLDRADFTTHQARRILKRLGFVAARAEHHREEHPGENGDRPYGGRQAEALRPHIGKWVALAGPTEVLVAADSPQEVLGWLAQHERRAPYGMFRVPASETEAAGVAPE